MNLSASWEILPLHLVYVERGDGHWTLHQQMHLFLQTPCCRCVDSLCAKSRTSIPLNLTASHSVHYHAQISRWWKKAVSAADTLSYSLYDITEVPQCTVFSFHMSILSGSHHHSRLLYFLHLVRQITTTEPRNICMCLSLVWKCRAVTGIYNRFILLPFITGEYHEEPEITLLTKTWQMWLNDHQLKTVIIL